MRPDGVENEEELNENTSEGQHTSHQNTWQRLSPETLLGDGSWDGVGSHRVLNHVFLESEVRSNESKRDRNSEPQTNEGTQGNERYRGRTSLTPQEDVEEEDNSKNDSWTQKRSEEDIRVPPQSTKHLKQKFCWRYVFQGIFQFQQKIFPRF